MKIELLQGSLPVTENPGLDSSDPRFDEIATLVQGGQYAEAAKLSETILAEGIYDIRLMCYFLYGYWLELDLLSLLDVMNCLNHIILENWQAVGPVKKREKFFQTSFNWLFRQVLKKIQYEEKKKTALWQQWKSSINIDDVEKILAASDVFQANLGNRLENNAEAVLELWFKIAIWLRALQRVLVLPEEPVPIESPEPQQAEENTAESVTAIPMTTFKSDAPNIEVSYPMELLLKKLAAFEWLLQNQNFSRAALVAEDINQTLGAFDPLVYFPKTFGTFVRLQALNFEELSVYEEHQGSPQWQAMQHWLKTDIDSFMNN